MTSAHLLSPSTAALVTGCSSGIGRAVALALHDAGHAVYATARRPESIKDLGDAGLGVLALDVTDEASMVAAVDRVVADHGAVGVLVNNAGYGLQGTIEEAPLDSVRQQFETNVFGLVRLTQLVLPGMRGQGWGRIVNVGSMGGRFTFPGGGYYHASKHAVEAISDALRLEVAPFGVRVSLVQPGPVRTEFAGTAIGTLDEGEPQAGANQAYAEFHRDLEARFAETYDESSSRNPSVDDVAKAVLRAVSSEHPRARYAVGLLAKTLITGRRLLPDPAWDRLIRSSWPIPRSPGE
jgi:NAD(P)-dependent dehydrogenase (short-subunit alcohol dehydrogenase family)